MPGQDGTGPMGEGPMTGRGLGLCGGSRAWRRTFGRGAGWRRSGISLTKEEQKKILEAEKQEIDKRIEELNK